MKRTETAPAKSSRRPCPEHLLAIAYRLVSDILPAGREIRDSEEYGVAILDMTQAMPGYDPDKGTFASYMYRVGRNAIFRMSRNVKRQAKYLGSRQELNDDIASCDSYSEAEMREELHAVLDESGLAEQFERNGRLGSNELSQAKRTAYLRSARTPICG